MTATPPPKLEDELPEGTQIGFYKILGKADATGRVVTRVGAGGFGSVYRVQRDALVFALKISALKMSALDSEERQHQEDRFQREASNLSAVKHPNIVRVHAYDYWPTRDDHPFLVMDFVEGLRLYEWQRRLNPSLRQICDVIIKLAMALFELHRHGIFHRDVKSENVIVRPDGEPVLLDLGIARGAANFTLTTERSMVGTYALFAPEQCRTYLSDKFAAGVGRFEPTPQSELHSLGYLFYVLLAGRSPFPHDIDEFALMRSIASHIPVPPSTVNPRVPGALDALVMKLLEKEPANRHSSGKELAVDLDSLVAEVADSSWDSPFDVPTPPPHGAPIPPDRRRSADRSPPPKAAEPQVSAERPIVRPPATSPAVLEGDKIRAPDSSAFSPPTVESNPHFVSPVSTPPLLPAAPSIQSDDLVRAAAKLQEAHRSGARKRASPLVAATLAAVVLGGLLLFISKSGAPAKPRNLLEDAQREVRTAAGADAGTAAGPPENAAAALKPPPAARSLPIAATSTVLHDAPRAASATTSNRDLHEIDAEISRTYGRPQVPAAGGASAAAPDAGVAAAKPPAKHKIEQPSWMQIAEAEEDPVPAKASNAVVRYGVPTGAHIPVRLLTNLDSRTISSGPVEARLVRPYIAADKTVFPSRTLLYGTASAGGSRFTVRFNRIRLPDDTEIPFEGIAFDPAERKPGLAARLVGTPAAVSSSGSNIGTKVAGAVASTALSVIGGDLASDAAREAGQVVLRDATSSDQQSVPAGQALLLDAGKDFDCFVQKAF